MTNFKKSVILMVSLICTIHLTSQETFPRNDVLDKRSDAYAFTNATIVVDHNTTITNGVLLVQKGEIVDVGGQVTIPSGYIRIDLSGKHIYPSMIDLHTNYGIPKEKPQPRRSSFRGPEQIMSDTKGAYNANEAIKSHFNASDVFAIDEKSAVEWRKHGFGAVLSFRADGIARGTSALVSLGESSENEVVLNHRAGAHYSFNKGTSSQSYPGSMMGYISLLRQTYLDASWYSSHEIKPFTDQTLDAWIAHQKLPQFFDAGNWMNVLRADKVGKEFDVNYIIKSSGNDYQRVAEIKNTGASLIIPVNFPDAYDVSDPLDAEKVSLTDMKHWELAPTNPATLEKNDVTFAFTSSGLKKKTDFMANIRKAIKHGLSESTALAALTSTPASLVNMEDRIGSLKKGMIANFIITTGPLFDEKTELLENWIQGKAFSINPLHKGDYAGVYELSIDDKNYQLEVRGKPGAQKFKIMVNDSTHIDVSSKIDKDLITLGVKETKEDQKEIRLSGWKTDSGWKGTGQHADGTWMDWAANRKGDLPSKDSMNGSRGKQGSKSDPDDSDKLGNVIYPFIAFGREQLPNQEKLLIKNATVWTNESEGILTATDVLLSNGKIERIGQNLSESGARVIDGTGKHLTSGIIDEHTHIGGGGNERATNSGMVRIGDQINPEQINIYRTLAGGVTAAQVLHGSANPIGGQSALIKLRWGESPENMKIDGADGFIKFALGENVKRSSNPQSIRYPQTRMGVEQVFVDAFTNAKEYEKKWNAYQALSSDEKANTVQPRRDLVHETMLEIVNGERFITCHSYVQSEINMLMKVAEQFGFRIKIFTHILEGYKVADKMREHGVGASTFSDWWNYKWEVRYAIPYNAAIMHREGVLTAINSDDSNMGRRLNQEAAKAIKYGGIPEEEAWKMVTLNPAIMLNLDDRMGSIKVGKDADVVLWTDHPLSTYAKADKTIIDGKVYFDLAEDDKARDDLRQERARLIQKMKGVKKRGGATQRPNSRIQLEFHCDDDHYSHLIDHD